MTDKFEYTVVTIAADDLIVELNELGNIGWEAFSLIHAKGATMTGISREKGYFTNMMPDVVTVYLKRKKG